MDKARGRMEEARGSARLLLQLLLFHELDDLNLLPDPDLVLLREAVVVLGLLRAVELVELGLHRGHLLLAVFLEHLLHLLKLLQLTPHLLNFLELALTLF